MKLSLLVCIVFALIGLSVAAFVRPTIESNPMGAPNPLDVAIQNLLIKEPSNADHQGLFKVWAARHNKTYESDAEESQRFEAFSTSVERVKALATLHNDPNMFGLNVYSDLTEQEFKQRFLSSLAVPADFASAEVAPSKVTPAPSLNPNEVYGWGSNVVTPVNDQGACGCCWAFSAMETIESYWSLAGKGQVQLSAQQIVDCDTNDGGCGGGWPMTAFGYVQSTGGIESAANYPWTSGNGQSGQCHANNQWSASISGSEIVAQNNEPAMLNELLNTGPLSIAVAAGTWQNYPAGTNQIWTASQCDSSIDHAVQLVGVATDGNGNPDAWYIRNQWGSGWGNNGYIFLQYGANACQVSYAPAIVNI